MQKNHPVKQVRCPSCKGGNVQYVEEIPLGESYFCRSCGKPFEVSLASKMVVNRREAGYE